MTFRDKGGGREGGGKRGKGWPSERYSWQRRRCNNCPHPSSTRDRLEQREEAHGHSEEAATLLIVVSISLSFSRSLRAVKDGENNRNRRRSRLRDKRCYHPIHYTPYCVVRQIFVEKCDSRSRTR